MLGAVLALAIAGPPSAAWLPVHEDEEATTSIAARAVGRAGAYRTVAVRTMFRDAAAGGFIHALELDCAAGRLRAVHETILDGRGQRVTDGPSLSSAWITPPEGAPFRAVLTRVCAPDQ
ncbi:MAG TPA: surface-adhesin E family protein [Allosphingosinicella sp.]|nr:surface-adhesin E family protein [Allosphingosinicella sp.]